MISAKNFFFAMVVVMLLALAGSGGLFYYFNGRLSQTINSIEQREVDIVIGNEEIASLDELQKQLLSIKDVKPAIDGALPKSKTQSEIVSQVLEIAKNNGINFSTITFVSTQGLPAENSQTKTSKLLPAVSTVPVTLEAASISYGQLKSFLRDVLSIRRNANVSALILTRDATTQGNVTARITLDIHLEKVTEALTEEEKAKLKAAAGKEEN